MCNFCSGKVNANRKLSLAIYSNCLKKSVGMSNCTCHYASYLATVCMCVCTYCRSERY